YSGLEPLKVNAFLDLPSGFDITPQNINTIIQPTSFITFNFKVRAPKDNAGAYVGTFSVVGNQGQIQKTTSLIVASNPVAADLSVYIAVAIGMLVLFAVFLVLRRSDGSENTGGGERIGSEERGTYLKELKGLFD
ncbi:TPA: hypothetical protein HA244_03155, partial [Candidatus Micrarchaeota archaeon]|nr:hypothetical protein [Candidatus Micrarchaeota archaeon]